MHLKVAGNPQGGSQKKKRGKKGKGGATRFDTSKGKKIAGLKEAHMGRNGGGGVE